MDTDKWATALLNLVLGEDNVPGRNDIVVK